MDSVLAVILAGGKGSRLEPLTRDRAKPAVPFGGAYRIIDFALSNCLNSGLRKMLVLTQYKAMSLDRHINLGWRRFLCRELGEFIDVVPPQQRIDEHWYQGTADAVYQNIYTLEKERPEYVVILAGDHIYKMDYMKLVESHRETRADLTVAALPVSVDQARQFGVMEIESGGRIVGFEEKPQEAPKTIPDEPDRVLASMGIYVFTARFLFEQLCLDATRAGSAHDFGKDIIPSIIHTHPVYAFPFRDENRKQDAYWRDVGTLDAYYEANMDLVSVDPLLNMYDHRWPLRTYLPNFPPPKFVFAEEGIKGRRGDRQHRLPRLDRLRRPRGPFDRRCRRSSQQLRTGGGLDSVRGCRRRSSRRRAAGNRRQGRTHPAGRTDRCQPRRRPRSRLHRQRRGHHGYRQGRRRGTLRRRTGWERFVAEVISMHVARRPLRSRDQSGAQA
jgi:glucose-1-phosphate adenylyltransferase